MDVSFIFCYGSLRSGFWNHDRYCGDALTIEPAVTTGLLYHLPQGFPAMFDAPDGTVYGEAMTFPDIRKTIEALDYLEGYLPHGRCHYMRIAKRVTILPDGMTVPAWVYVYPENKLQEIQRVGTLVPRGCWRTFITRNMTRSATHS